MHNLNQAKHNLSLYYAVSGTKQLEFLGLSSSDIETDWASIIDAIYAAATEVIGTTNHKYQDWFDENYAYIQKLLEGKIIFT